MVYAVGRDCGRALVNVGRGRGSVTSSSLGVAVLCRGHLAKAPMFAGPVVYAPESIKEK